MRKLKVSLVVSAFLILISNDISSNVIFIPEVNDDYVYDGSLFDGSGFSSPTYISKGAEAIVKVGLLQTQKYLKEELHNIEAKLLNVYVTIGKISDELESNENKLKKLNEKKDKAKKNNKKKQVKKYEEEIKKLSKKIDKQKVQKEVLNELFVSGKQVTETIKKEAESLDLGKGVKNTIKKYGSASVKKYAFGKAMEGLDHIGKAATGLFVVLDGILAAEGLEDKSEKLIEIYPELSDILSLSRWEYFGKVLEGMLQPSTSVPLAATGVGRLINNAPKLVSRVGGGIITAFALFFSDIPRGLSDPYDPMPDPDVDIESFLHWFTSMHTWNEENDYKQRITTEAKTGKGLNIPRGIMEFWQMIYTVYPDPEMFWIFNWSFDEKGNAKWTDPRSELSDLNKKITLQLTADTTLNPTSHFGAASTPLSGEQYKVHNYNYVIANKDDQNFIKTKQENPFFAQGAMVLQPPVDIALHWGDNPADLDSHLVGPSSHTWFGNKGSLYTHPYTMLYRDNVSHGHGDNSPEQTRINATPQGRYNFYVHDYSNQSNPNSTALSNSGAVVTVHSAGSRELPEGENLGKQVAHFNVPKNKAGILWHTFEIDTARGAIIPKDTIKKDDSAIRENRTR